MPTTNIWPNFTLIDSKASSGEISKKKEQFGDKSVAVPEPSAAACETVYLIS